MTMIIDTISLAQFLNELRLESFDGKLLVKKFKLYRYVQI